MAHILVVDDEPAARGTFALLLRKRGHRVLEAEGVMFTPGSALDMEGYVRIGYANNRAVLEEGLPRVSRFLRTLNSKIRT